MFNFIALLMVVLGVGAFYAVVEICGDHIEDWWKGRLK